MRSAGGSGTRLQQLLAPHTGEGAAAAGASEEGDSPGWLKAEGSGAPLLAPEGGKESALLVSKVVTTKSRAFAGDYAPMIAGPTLLCITRDAKLAEGVLKAVASDEAIAKEVRAVARTEQNRTGRNGTEGRAGGRAGRGVATTEDECCSSCLDASPPSASLTSHHTMSLPPT